MGVDYDNMYAAGTQVHFDWIKKAAQWKAKKLCELIKGEETDSILEIGAGRGDVLNACELFRVRIGADISSEALEQQQREYSTKRLEMIDADSPLPFGNDEVNFVLLCDILEHVEDPIELLREAGRVGKNVLLKIPIERAILVCLMQKIRGVEYGEKHPSGHLHCWSLKDVLGIIDQACLVIIRSDFVPTPIDLFKQRTWFKKILYYFTTGADSLMSGKFVTRFLIGGSLFALARKKSSFREKPI